MERSCLEQQEDQEWEVANIRKREAAEDGREEAPNEEQENAIRNTKRALLSVWG
jgi:hypothetical protein